MEGQRYFVKKTNIFYPYCTENKKRKIHYISLRFFCMQKTPIG